MGRLIAFLGAAILIIIGLVFIFDIDMQSFTSKETKEVKEEIPQMASEPHSNNIEIGGIVLGEETKIDSAIISISGLEGKLRALKRGTDTCFMIEFKPFNETISSNEFEQFKYYLENKFQIEFTKSNNPLKLKVPKGYTIISSWSAYKEDILFKIQLDKQDSITLLSHLSIGYKGEVFRQFFFKHSIDSIYTLPPPPSLKGITLGEKNPKTQIHTTVGGINGIISILNLNDGTTYGIKFVPTGSAGITEQQLEEFRIGVENKYDIKLIKEKSLNSDYGLASRTGNVIILIEVKNYDPSTSDVWIRLVLMNTDLTNRHFEEEQDKINNDF